MRSVRWDILEKSPPVEGGKTQLQGPNPQQRAYFQNLVAQKDWKTALEKAEAAFASGANHFWLDLQRIIVMACKELGVTYSAVRNAVLLETAYFLNRVPEVVSMAFSDGLPFCDDATKDWINTEVAAALSSGSASGAASGASDPLDAEMKEVNGLVAAGQFEQAMDLVQKSIRSSSTERDNFRRMIAIGSLLLKAKQPDISVSVMESLDQKISAYNLERWDPDIAVEAWSVLVQAYKVGKATKPQNIQVQIQERQNIILSKISQIDPKKAFTLNK
jgi:type VI secretion system protein VasJ